MERKILFLFLTKETFFSFFQIVVELTSNSSHNNHYEKSKLNVKIVKIFSYLSMAVASKRENGGGERIFLLLLNEEKEEEKKNFLLKSHSRTKGA